MSIVFSTYIATMVVCLFGPWKLFTSPRMLHYTLWINIHSVFFQCSSSNLIFWRNPLWSLLPSEEIYFCIGKNNINSLAKKINWYSFLSTLCLSFPLSNFRGQRFNMVMISWSINQKFPIKYFQLPSATSLVFAHWHTVTIYRS